MIFGSPCRALTVSATKSGVKSYVYQPVSKQVKRSQLQKWPLWLPVMSPAHGVRLLFLGPRRM